MTSSASYYTCTQPHVLGTCTTNCTFILQTIHVRARVSIATSTYLCLDRNGYERVEVPVTRHEDLAVELSQQRAAAERNTLLLLLVQDTVGQSTRGVTSHW